MNVRFCPSCRGLVLASFRFCPYCGLEVKGPDLSEALEEPFARMGRQAGSVGESMEVLLPDPFAAAEESLDRLEADMDLLLEAIERESRGFRP